MIHKGNISKIKITPEDIVDCVIGGSPCQGLSVAGARAGLNDERSGLFMEQIRVMKEMRALDQASGRTGIHVRCRWGIWENVPGALSSNGGEDFRIVLEEFCKVADPDASVPRPANGKWNSSGCIVGDSYSVAWRILDARYHGVPQRRRRITLVADFAARCAPPVLFDSEGMYWNFEQSKEAWKRAAGNAQGSAGGSCGAFHLQQDPISGDISPCIGAQRQATVGVFMGGQGAKAKGIGWSETIAPTIKSVMSGSNTVPNVVYGIEGNTIDRCSSKNGKGWCEAVSPTLNTQDKHAVAYAPSANFCGSYEKSDCSATMSTKYHFGSGGDGKTVCTITGDHCNRESDYTPIVINETVGCLCARDYKGVGLQYVEEGQIIPLVFNKKKSNEYGIGMVGSTLTARDYKDGGDLVVSHGLRYIVRRLTPLECSRLQGLRDDWCAIPAQESVTDEDIAFWKPFWDEWMQINGKQPKTENQIRKWLMSEVSESAQYQMYGNGIAAPQWFWVCGRVIETYGLHKPTMASLFDGTGSFPWIWNSILGGDYTVWSSEVNPEAVRVSKYRIG